MPRTAQEIIDHADELEARFEQAEPDDLREPQGCELSPIRLVNAPARFANRLTVRSAA